MPYTELVNPVLTPLDDEIEEGWEGCLSVPGLRGIVSRYRRLRYEGLDPSGMPIRREVEGFHARVVQHECDHLDGILYPMRMQDFTRFGFTDVLFPELSTRGGVTRRCDAGAPTAPAAGRRARFRACSSACSSCRRAPSIRNTSSARSPSVLIFALATLTPAFAST